MPGLRDAGKNLSRLREISSIVALNGFGNVFDRARVFEALGFRPKDTDQTANKRLSTPERFCRMLTELGPTFVKFGQVLSSRPDVIPPTWVQALSTLQDQVPALPIERVHEVIEAGLGAKIDVLFDHIEEAPLASASIAQVHKARLKTGEDVVVKVQRPDISSRIDRDLDLLYYFAQFLEKVVEETGIYKPTGLVEEFERSLKNELDFTLERRHIELFYENNKDRDYVVIPLVYPEVCCKTVLTMERLDGVKITGLDPEKYDLPLISRNLIQAIFDHMFIDGIFHGDPHPGNLFVIDGEKIGFVDFGLVGRMTKSMQETFIVLCLALALRDPDSVARVVYKSGVPDKRVNLSEFRMQIVELLDEYEGLELQQIDSGTLTGQLLELSLNYGIKVPKDYAILTKAGITMEGIIRDIYPEMDIIEVATPYAKQLLYDRVSPNAASGGALRALLHGQAILQEVPLQLSQILMDLESGKFTVTVTSEDMPKLVSSVRWLGLVVFSGLTSSALIMGSFYVLATQTDWKWHGVPVLAIIGLGLTPMLFGWAFLSTLMGGRSHKISLRRLFKRGP